MLTVDVLDVQGFGPAIRGMRNPMNSWNKSDSFPAVDCKRCGEIEREGFCRPADHDCREFECFSIGPNDLDLMRRLFQAGTEHRKFARMIQVYLNVTAPLYWRKEFDTYKVGTVCNSCSTMHKIHSKEFTLDDFSHEHLMTGGIECIKHLCMDLNLCRNYYLETKDKEWWWQMIQLLPTSYNQTRTVMLSYENAFTIRRQRKNHKLDEWHILCDALLNLPYYREITGEE